MKIITGDGILLPTRSIPSRIRSNRDSCCFSSTYFISFLIVILAYLFTIVLNYKDLIKIPQVFVKFCIIFNISLVDNLRFSKQKDPYHLYMDQSC